MSFLLILLQPLSLEHLLDNPSFREYVKSPPICMEGGITMSSVNVQIHYKNSRPGLQTKAATFGAPGMGAL